MGATVPVSDAEREQIRLLHAKGFSANAIAKEIGRSQSSVTRLCKAMGLSFDREKIRKATEARRADIAEIKTRLIVKNYQKAEHLLDRVDAPYTVAMSGPVDIVYVTTTLPPLRDAQAGMAGAGIGVDKAMKLEAAQQGAGPDHAKSMLGKLMASLAEAFGDETDVPQGDG